MSDGLRELERICGMRARKERDLTMTRLVQQAADSARRTQKRLGAAIDLWEELVPAELVSRTRLLHMRSGTLHVEVDDSATAYELDRYLREGLEAAIRSRFRGTLTRIRVRIGTTPE